MPSNGHFLNIILYGSRSELNVVDHCFLLDVLFFSYLLWHYWWSFPFSFLTPSEYLLWGSLLYLISIMLFFWALSYTEQGIGWGKKVLGAQTKEALTLRVIQINARSTLAQSWVWVHWGINNHNSMPVLAVVFSFPPSFWCFLNSSLKLFFLLYVCFSL